MGNGEGWLLIWDEIAVGKHEGFDLVSLDQNKRLISHLGN